jgi:hypothetical protein
MNIGEPVIAEIKARPFWNETGIQLILGETYLITAEGQWVDFYIRHDPNGDPSPNEYMRSFESQRRLPQENWFVLAGALNSDASTAFRIGSRRTYTPAASGQLTCFANDVEGFYWNNWGHVTMTVTRTA